MLFILDFVSVPSKRHAGPSANYAGFTLRFDILLFEICLIFSKSAVNLKNLRGLGKTGINSEK
jgi:hypothetical protein